jgi:hypothetical protein
MYLCSAAWPLALRVRTVMSAQCCAEFIHVHMHLFSRFQHTPMHMLEPMLSGCDLNIHAGMLVCWQQSLCWQYTAWLCGCRSACCCVLHTADHTCSGTCEFPYNAVYAALFLTALLSGSLAACTQQSTQGIGFSIACVLSTHQLCLMVTRTQSVHRGIQSVTTVS